MSDPLRNAASLGQTLAIFQTDISAADTRQAGGERTGSSHLHPGNRQRGGIVARYRERNAIRICGSHARRLPLDLRWDREQLARCEISVEDAQKVVENAIGGDNASTVVQGRERYGVNVRYLRDFRGDVTL